MMNAFTTRYDSVSFNEQQSDVKAIRESVEKEQQDVDTANAVIAAIEAIGTVDYDGEGRGRLVNAENMYNVLTPEQRRIVDESVNGLSLLQQKQREWLEEKSKKEQADEAARQAQLAADLAIKQAAEKAIEDANKPSTQGITSKIYSVPTGADRLDTINRLGLPLDASSSEIIKALKKAGFSSGGIIDASGIKRATCDDGLAFVKHGEAILTPEQTKMFQNMVQVMPPFVNAMNTFTNIPSLSQAKITPNQQSISMGDLVLNLPNVTDTESFIKTIKTDTKVQKAIQQTVCDQLSGRGKLNIMKL